MESSKETKKIIKTYCRGNLKRFLRETTLHGLKYLADDSITLWEKSFFMCAFLAAIITTANLIVNVYAKWISTPVIIGISPHATSILNIPFPAITVCNMNQVLAGRVANYTPESEEGALLKIFCNSGVFSEDKVWEAPNFKNNNLKFEDFLNEHAQPCSKMLLSCSYGADGGNCSDLFQEIISDEGFCCVFNILQPNFLLTRSTVRTSNMRKPNKARKPIDWNPETGYPSDLPPKYTPRAASGTGVTMGLSLVLDSALDEYYCSTTNGPGFKVGIHSPIESTSIKETAYVFPVGYETRVRIEVVSSEATENLRTMPREDRQCLFNGEENLLFYAHYSRRNCESECQVKFIYEQCKCQPFNLPLIYENATICGVQQVRCVQKVDDLWMKGTSGGDVCWDRCLPPCFDLSYKADATMSPLRQFDYLTPPSILRNMSMDYVNKHVAVLHFYYRESVFHGNVKNVYVGFTEFLSNTGGIMGLFLGFSFISVAEIIYFAFMRPICELITTLRKRRMVARKKKSLLVTRSQLQPSHRIVKVN
ncbi:pickpocket protein 28 [Eurosta solidaginis]|uniref:pickpocket protein 28 n=1 Tax=Eurosta solidaginis TaxID=178769 RepID=UPI003530E3D5